MKSKLQTFVVLMFFIQQGFSQDWPAFANRIVTQTAGIKAGDVVWISCGTTGLPLAEQIAAEVHRKGANPQIAMTTDVEQKAMLYDKPEANLADFPDYFIQWQKQLDYMITITPQVENSKSLYGNVDPKRMALLGSNVERLLSELAANTHYSDIAISLPSKEIPSITGIDLATYEKMHWAAASADYTKIASSGKKIMNLLKGAKNVKLTTQDGTNLSFSMGDRLVFADDGILTEEERNSEVMYARYALLPGGFLDFAPLESSVNGTVVIEKARCNYGPMKGVSFTVKNGVISNFKAKEGGACFEKEMEPHTGDKNTISTLNLGLNPEMKVIQTEKIDFHPLVAAGYMSLSIGGNNSQYNGKVVASGGHTFPLIKATLEIDGKVVVKDGKIME